MTTATTPVWHPPMTADERNAFNHNPQYGTRLDSLRDTAGWLHDDHGITVDIQDLGDDDFNIRYSLRPLGRMTFDQANRSLYAMAMGAQFGQPHYPYGPYAWWSTPTDDIHGPHAILTQAEHEARALGHNYIGTEHLLLVLTYITTISDMLCACGVSPVTVREHTRNIIGAGHGAPDIIGTTHRARTVLDDLAITEAARLGHNHLDATHVLLGLLAEGEGIGAHVLNGLGITLDRARQHHTQPRPAA